ncbi:phage terminase large subunit [Desulfovibrio sp. OttesenSCG-928-I05]|nr:phage terminase large subunit [Desulfovibrio sp. OttesenSCG-928-I05]
MEKHTQLVSTNLRFAIPPLPPTLANDFRAFLVAVWLHLGLPHPTPVQLDIAHYLQHGPSRRVIAAFRGVGKSWITSAYVVWRLRNNPALKFLVVSASKDRADNFTTFTQHLIADMPLLQCLKPHDNQRCSKVAFDVGPAQADHAPSVTSKGITSQLAGSRADEIVSDDVEVMNNSLTQGQRDKLGEAVKEYEAILKPGGIITYLGTYQTEMSLYTQLPARGYDVRIWPAKYPTIKQIEAYGERLAPSILKALEDNSGLTGMSTDPLRFSEEDLMARELSYGKAGFALQFMLDPQLSDADRYPLKLSDLTVMDLAPDEAPEKIIWCSAAEKALPDLPCVGLRGDRYHAPMKVWDTWLPYTGAVMAIDPSGRGQDETSYAVVKMLNGYLFLTAAGGIQGGYGPAVMEKLASIAKQQKVHEIVVESNFGDGMFTELFKPHLQKANFPVAITEVRHSIQKERRICDTLEPVMAQHRLIVDKSLIRQDYESTQSYATEHAHKYQLFYQIARITRERGALSHDDRLDALAIAVAHWIDLMAVDADKMTEQRKEDLLLKELENWTSSIQGSPFGFDMTCIAGVGVIQSGKTSSILGTNRQNSSFRLGR